MRFLRDGEGVIIHGRTAVAVDRALSDLCGDFPHVEGVAANLADREAIRRLAEACGPIDVLVNNVGFYIEGTAEQVTAEVWNQLMAVNVSAAWFLSRAFLKGLREKRGVIVNIASDAAFIGIPAGSAYCASKGAIVVLTRALAIELMPDVRVMCVCPGPVDTDMMQDQMKASSDPEAMRSRWMNFAPLKRVARPEEIASVVACAVAQDTGFATGAAWLINGGQTAGKRPG